MTLTETVLPAPYYQSEDMQITLYCGDCRAILPLLQPVDFVYADPPYGIDVVKTSGVLNGRPNTRVFGRDTRKGNEGGGTADAPFGTVGRAKPFGSTSNYSLGKTCLIEPGRYAQVVGDDSPETAIAASALCLELWPKAVQVWWGGNYYAHALPPSSCWIVWDKENTGNFADAELAWTNQKTAVRIARHMWNGLLKASERNEKRIHPTQKPVVLAAWVLQKYGPQDGLILDPFAGSGSTLMAAKKLNRPCIGVEISEEYCSLIVKRLAQGTLGI